MLNLEKGEILYGDKKVSDYVSALYTDGVYESVEIILNYMITLHDKLAEVIDWSSNNISQYKAEVEAAVDYIKKGGYTSYTYDFLNDLIIGWRADFFEVIYAYYYYGTEEEQDYISSDLFQTVSLPGKLRDLYVNVRDAYLLAKDFKDYATETIWYDTRIIFEAYDNVVQLKKEIYQENDELIVGLYELLRLDSFVETNLIYVDNGYKDQSGELFGDDKFQAMWKDYLDIFDLAVMEAIISSFVMCFGTSSFTLLLIASSNSSPEY